MVPLQDALQPTSYVLLNIASATGIVFANKIVLSVYNFHFVYALTLVHTLVTTAGMWLFAALGIFQPKAAPVAQTFPLAAAFVGYVVFWNVSLQLNPVGFYQLTKICIAPAVIALEAICFKKLPTRMELAAIGVLCLGVMLATVTDSQVAANMAGILVAFAAIWTTAIYQIWAGSKQKALGLGSLQLMHLYAPQATMLLAVLVPIMEPLGWARPTADTILGYPYTPGALATIGASAVLGLLVSMSTFLVIGALSSVTFNVVGHSKTMIILAGGCLLFQEPMPPKKLAGVLLALAGIGWYSYLKLAASATAKTAAALAAKTSSQPLANGHAGEHRASPSAVPHIGGGGSEPRARGKLEDEEAGGGGQETGVNSMGLAAAGAGPAKASPRPGAMAVPEKVPLLDGPFRQQGNTPLKKPAAGWSLWR